MRLPVSALVIVPLVILTAGCAVKLPPPATFNATDWTRVESLRPGTWVQVRYLYGDPLIRHTFEGELRAARPDVLEVATRDGMQRLLPQRVLRVVTGGREGSRVIPAAALGALLGGLLGGALSAINEKNDADTKSTTMMFGGAGALLGLGLGNAQAEPRPVVVYSRWGSL